MIVGAAGMSLSLLACSWAFSGSHFELTPDATAQLRVEKLPDDLLAEMTSVDHQTFFTEKGFLDHLERKYGSQRIEAYRKELARAALQMPPYRANVVLIGILGFVASFAISLGPVMSVLVAEIFPTQLRGAAISLAGFWNSLVSFSVTATFPWVMVHWGMAATYLALAVMALATLVFVWAMVPETKGKTLEELEHLLVTSRRGMTTAGRRSSR